MTRREILRWGGVPLAALVGVVVYAILYALLRAFVSSVGGINPDGGLAQFLTVPLPAVAGTALAVALGTLFAPHHKRETTSALLVAVMGGVVVFGLPAALSGGPHYAVLFACGGSAFGAYISKELLRFDS